MKPYYPVTLLCKIAKIDRTSYYKWLNKDTSKDSTLFEAMQQVYFEYDKTCGYRRMHSELKDRGFKISEKKVREKMHEFNFESEIRRKKKFKTYSKPDGQIAVENKLNREFKTDCSNQKYCTDMTAIETKNGVVYCSAIIDLFNLQPFGLKFSKSCNTDLAEASLIELAKNRDLNGALLHTDQGVTYKNKRFVSLLESLNMTFSMSKKGCPYDNCLMENFWGTLKVEKIYRLKNKPENIEELKAIIEDYFKFYIYKRKSTALGYLTPAQYYDKNIKNIEKIK